jgi:predicted MFS family arabinose efflux permease
LHWLWRQPALCFIALLGSAVHIFGSGMLLLVIVQAQRQHTSPLIIGLILGAGGVGTMLGAFLAGPLQKRFSFVRLTLITQWLSALFFPLFVLVPGQAEIAGVVALLSMVMTVFGVIQFSYRLALIPDELQGRVNSVYRLVLFAGDPLGLALTGALLQVIGVMATV